MTIAWQEQLRPGLALREIVTQATTALIAMDAQRLEELARCCADLNRDLEDPGARAEAARELQESQADLRLLRQVLFETRANLTVLTRLHSIRIREAAALASGPTGGRSGFASTPLATWDWRERKAEYGDD